MTELTTVDRFSTVTTENFEPEVERLWGALDAVRDCITAQVSEGRIPPLTGIGMLATCAAQTLGYGLFQNEPTLVDLLSTRAMPSRV